MSFDNLQNKWTKEETELLVSLVKGRDITDSDLFEEALERLPARNKGGIKRKLERLKSDGKLKVAPIIKLQPEFRRMINMLTEEYDFDEIGHAIGLTGREIKAFYDDSEYTPPEKLVEEKAPEKPKGLQAKDYAGMIKEGATIEQVADRHKLNLEALQKALVPHLRNEIDNFNELVAGNSMLTQKDREVLANDNIVIPEPIEDRITDEMYRVGHVIQKYTNNGWMQQPFYLNHHKLVRFYYDGQALD